MASFLIKSLGFSGRVAPLMECMRGIVTDHSRDREQQPLVRPELLSDLLHHPATEMAPIGPGAFHHTAALWCNKDTKGGDWRCVCGFSNFASRSMCFGCHRPREGVAHASVKPGDWTCACGTHNFARRTHCMTCDAPKPANVAQAPATATTVTAPSNKERILPGDWRCTSCSAHNFRSRTACVKCGASRSTAAEVLTPPTPWSCVGCHTANDATVDNCHICGLARPTAAVGSNNMEVFSDLSAVPPTPPSLKPTPAAPQREVPLRPGDWFCPNCKFANFSSRANCKECATARPVAAGEAVPKAAQRVMHGDWTCSCGFHNFARRQRCFECNAVRVATASE